MLNDVEAEKMFGKVLTSHSANLNNDELIVSRHRKTKRSRTDTILIRDTGGKWDVAIKLQFPYLIPLV